MALLILDTTVREEDIQSLQLWCAGQAVSTWVAVIGISLISCVSGTENLISIEKKLQIIIWFPSQVRQANLRHNILEMPYICMKQ